MNNLDLINKRINELLSKTHPKELKKATLYAINANAKRFRPLLTLTIIDILGKNCKRGLDAACSIEFIHTYSLIHDDLPCIDNDDFRRGRPSLHKVFPEWLALLTGDFFLNFAFETLSNMKTISDKQKIKLIATLTKRSGDKCGMIGGQILDMINSGKSNWKTIYYGKTAALIIAAIEFGCIIANADNKTVKKLIKYGENIGLLYQIIDDLIDHETKKQSILTNTKNPEIKKIIKNLYTSTIKTLEKMPYNTKILENILRKIIDQFPTIKL